MTNQLEQDTAEYPLPTTTTVDLAALTHAGKVRQNNEDVYLVARYGRFLQTLLTNLPPGCVPDRSDEGGYGLVVADGVGGHAGGEVASRLAVSTLIRLALDTPDWILLPGDREREQVMERFRQRYRLTDVVLQAEASVDPALAGMRTTMTVACNLGPDMVLAHVGDSRAYLLRGTDFRQLTRDHTLVQELADAGGISPDQIKNHVFRHVITRALGGEGGLAEADIRRVVLADGDQVLLCSDGLTEMVETATIADTLRAAATAREACEALVELALEGGGKDNVTVVLARYKFESAA
jgi:serine/threonine protein phosphatase PrpC